MRVSALPRELEPHAEKTKSANGWLLRGGSAIIGPDGAFIVEPIYDKETILSADLDLGAVRREQMALDVSGHYSRRDCFDFRVLRDAGGRQVPDVP